MTAPTQTLVSPFGKYRVQSEPRPIPPHLMRFDLRGVSASGKSSLVATIGPRCMVLDFENKHGTLKIDGPRSQWFVPRNLAEVDSFIMDVLAEADKPNRSLDMVVFDTSNEFISGFLRPGMTDLLKANGKTVSPLEDVCDYGSGGGKGSKGWDLVNRRFASYMQRLQIAGYGWGMVGHLKEETFTVNVGGQQQERVRLSPILNPGIANSIERLRLVTAQVFRRESAVPKTKTITVGGVKKEVPDGATLQTEYLLTFDGLEQGATGLGGTVAVSGTYKLPASGAWESVMVAAYNAGLERRGMAPSGGAANSGQKG